MTITSELHKLADPPGLPEGTNARALSRFPFTLLLKITASEPRDVLQLERTALTFIRFACTLFFAALAIMLDFRFVTGQTSDTTLPVSGVAFATATSFILLALSLTLLIICGINYFVTVRQCAGHKIITSGVNHYGTILCMSSLVVVLVGICVSLVIQGYGEVRE